MYSLLMVIDLYNAKTFEPMTDARQMLIKPVSLRNIMSSAICLMPSSLFISNHELYVSLILADAPPRSICTNTWLEA
jgi:hypothetical protein